MRDATSPEFCSVGEFARAIGVTEKTVHRRIAAGQIAATRLGGKVLVLRTELHRIAAAATANLRPLDVPSPGPTMNYVSGVEMVPGGARRPR